MIDAGGTFLLKAIFQIGVFVYFTHVSDITTFGIISYVFTVYWFVLNFSDYGFRTKLVKDISDNSYSASELLSRSDGVKTYVFFFIFIIFMFYSYVSDSISLTLLVYISSAYFVCISSGRFSLLQAVGRFRCELYINIYSTIIYIGCNLFLSLFIEPLYYSAISIFIYSISLLVFSSHKCNVPCFHIKRPSILVYKDFLDATPFAILVLLNVVLSSIDLFILKEYFSYNSVAIYQVVTRVNTGLIIVFNVIYTVLLPSFSYYLKNSEWGNIRKLQRYISLLVLLLCLCYYFFGIYFVGILFGDEYKVISSATFLIMFMALIKYNFWLINELYLVCSGNQSERVKSYCIGVVISMAVFFYFIP
ncbi:oligosaccharide flippase family protein, partial [Shigella sonnei]|nr:transporter [Shigella sonnei]EGK5714157.1 oligosaccharide flippase family protein [Shigella sonnei]EIH7595733.1 oligosaccharide flippase family protein [Shigella sonnei]ELS5562600.1 oligosaccharide flippase family protein [Shigella sonnei]